MLLDAEPHGKVRSGGIDIAYWDVGEGEPLTLLTGLTTPAAAWGPFPSIIASMGYRVIVIDNRDAGCSGRSAGDYTMTEMAGDVISVLDHLDIASTFMVGISMGGMIAQKVGIDHPERVSRMVLIGTDPGGSLRVVDEDFWLGFLTLDASDPESYIREILSRMTGPGFADRDPAMMDMAVKARSSQLADAGCLSRQLQACQSFSAVEDLPGVKIPTLVIHGDCDPMILPENGRQIAGLIPGAELVMLSGIGHLSPMEAPAEILSHIQRFLPARAKESA